MPEPENIAGEDDLKEYAEQVEDTFLQDDDTQISPKAIAEAVGEAVRIKSHIEKDRTDQCGYCGQHFPPDENVIEKEIYGRRWAFCSDECYEDFLEKSNFKAADLDSDNSTVSLGKDQ